MSSAFVAIMMGSDSDLPAMQAAQVVLDELGVPYEMKITSAHRTPENTREYVADAETRGCGVFIAAAGMAAHLAGVTASLTTKPVIGVPLDTSPLNGIDALLSTVQMPPGIPVACVAIGRAGAKNAAHLAAQILALSDAALAARIKTQRNTITESVKAKDVKLQESLKNG